MSEHKIFVCKHVVEGKGIVGRLLDPDQQGVLDALLCDACHWIDLDKEMSKPSGELVHIYTRTREGLAEIDGEFFTESEVVSRGWLPRSRAMQFVLFMIEDSSGGVAVSCPTGLFYRRMDGSGLSDAETTYLWELFDRTFWGNADLTPQQEKRALQLVEKARANFRKPVVSEGMARR